MVMNNEKKHQSRSRNLTVKFGKVNQKSEVEKLTTTVAKFKTGEVSPEDVNDTVSESAVAFAESVKKVCGTGNSKQKQH